MSQNTTTFNFLPNLQMMNEIVLKDMGFCNRNFISKRCYLGILNQRKLQEAGFSIPERLTFNQARNNWLKVKAWAKGVTVKFEDKVEIEERKGDKIEKKLVPYVRFHTVFNIEQTESVKGN